MLVPAIAERRHPRTDLRWLPLIDVAPAAIHLAWRTASRVPGLREFVSIADELRREAAANGQPASRRPDPPPACRHYGMIVP
jgi:hypothetical protein